MLDDQGILCHLKRSSMDSIETLKKCQYDVCCFSIASIFFIGPKIHIGKFIMYLSKNFFRNRFIDCKNQFFYGFLRIVHIPLIPKKIIYIHCNYLLIYLSFIFYFPKPKEPSYIEISVRSEKCLQIYKHISSSPLMWSY